MNKLQLLIKEAEKLRANIPQDVADQIPALKGNAKITSSQEQYFVRKLRSAITAKKQEN